MFRCLTRFLMFSLILTSIAVADSAGWGYWKKAKTLFDENKFQEALTTLQSDPRQDFSYFYNLGTLYYKLGKLGPALAYLEKANRLYPHDRDIQHNLKITREQLARSIGSDRLDPASNWIEQLSDHTTIYELNALMGFLAFMALCLLTHTYWKNRSIRATLVNPAGIFSLMGTLIILGFCYIQKEASASPPAVCLEKLSVRSGPGDRYMELSQTEAGSKVRVLQMMAPPVASPVATDDAWKQIRFSENGIGWVRESGLLLL